ncbi:MAG: MucB/RseB C-terminal domain-containing protein [Betaproteobacteria bacterium]|nr:MucB/RseB C-terminal domain-containing protein [Betaproteobacteria bacterium]
MRRLVASLAVLGFVALPAGADSGQEANVWLSRVASAARSLNFTGTFVYQSGSRTETSRITHALDAGVEREKIEVLDGSPREIVRVNDEVRCFVADIRTVIIEKYAERSRFPGRLPVGLTDLTENYRVAKGEASRVADRESQLLILEPKDRLRHGYLFWVDQATGLLLKARTVDERGESLEQFHFTSVNIGGVIARDALRSRLERKVAEWKVHDARATEENSNESKWVFRTAVRGFRPSPGLRRKGDQGGEVMHYVFSDGLASISVFIERLGASHVGLEPRSRSAGAVNVYQRVSAGHLVTVLGEVPHQSLVVLGDGVEPRGR